LADFAPDAILRVLKRHDVRFVVIGGFAATIHGSPFVTTDVDITPERGRKNLERLSNALTELEARIRVEGIPEGLPFNHDAESLSRTNILNLTTKHGALDITLVPAGTAGYEDLAENAVSVRLQDLSVPVASLVDVIRAKEAAGRPKDTIAIPTLRRLVEAPKYLATAELLGTGQVLLTLRSTTLGTSAMEAQCKVRDPRRPDQLALATGKADPNSPGTVRVRYPEDFMDSAGFPLAPGRYEVRWVQARRDDRKAGQELASTAFNITLEGRFLPGSLPSI
jgi:hypothetical protein